MDFKNHPIQSILRVMGGFFVFLFCFLLLGSGGANWTGFPNFLCSLALALIFALKSPKWGAIIGVLVIAGAMFLTPIFEPIVAEKGLNVDTITEIILGTLEVFIFVVVLPGSIILMISKERRTIRKRKEKNAAAGVPCCPNCGSTMISYIQPHLKKKTYYYIASETSELINAGGYWECGQCGNTWG